MKRLIGHLLQKAWQEGTYKARKAVREGGSILKCRGKASGRCHYLFKNLAVSFYNSAVPRCFKLYLLSIVLTSDVTSSDKFYF